MTGKSREISVLPIFDYHFSIGYRHRQDACATFCGTVIGDIGAKSRTKQTKKDRHGEGEARIHLPLPACKPAFPLTFGPSEWWKRGRFIRFAQNDNYTFLIFCIFVLFAGRPNSQ